MSAVPAPMGREPRDRRERLDRLLVLRGLAPNRTRAQALILAGRVWSADQRLDKPGSRWPTDTVLRVAEGPRWVGRGGHKLWHALERFAIDVEDRLCLDVGASTGGFTHVLLERGARRVTALDVGRGQLDWSLRQDPRVDVLEGINARYLAREQLPYRPSRIVVDVSFISLERVLPAVVGTLDDEGAVVTLVKPQFEVGRGKVGRGGIVRDPALHWQVLERLIGFAASRGFGPCDACASPILGAEGNREFLLHLRPGRGDAGSALAAAARTLDESADR